MAANRLNQGTGWRAVVSSGLLALGLVAAASAQVAKQGDSELDALTLEFPAVTPATAGEPFAESDFSIASELVSSWNHFRQTALGEWQAFVDPRNGKIGYVEGSGLPWVPGYGNSLRLDGIAAPRAADGTVAVATLEALARAFLAEHGELLGVDPAELRLSPGRSGSPAPHLWLVDFDLVRGGLPVEGARVVFRVNNGNLIQFGSENLPPRGVAVPALVVTRDQAYAIVRDYVGNLDPAWDEMIDAGSEHLMPVAPALERSGIESPFGAGLELLRYWEFLFRRDGVVGTWRARVDAATGAIVGFRDVNDYVTARVTGGAHAGDGLPPDTILAAPFADLSIGGNSDSAGEYDYTSGTVTSTLNGPYVRILDNCGAISQNSGAGGNILFGSSTGTDCTTPGSGGAGNTRATRTQFYHVNRAKEIGRGWLPANAWLNAKLTVNVNLNQTCNAYWNGSTLNFFRSGGGCGNTGELPGVSLHEWGHGMDSNDGNGSSTDNGTGETYGDFSAALSTHASCTGAGFIGSNCGGYGNACTSCTGIRDIDWAKHSANVPSTVSNFTQVRCPAAGGYPGPCNREGHCESLVSSEALWDFAARDLPSPGSGAAWSVVDRLWYLGRSTSTGAFTCTTGGTWTSTGCAAGTNWRTMRAADDDDGNLANGTPHSCNLFAAFNRHGIACAADAGSNTCFTGCTSPATPTVTATPGNSQVALSWTSSGGGVVYDVYRNEVGCGAGFIRIATAVATTSYTDLAVANGTVYYYQVTAYPSGNGACAGAPSSCVNATPTSCSVIVAPSGVAATVTFGNQISVSWNDSATGTVTSYEVYRSTVGGGPYSLIGTVADTGAGPYVYVDNTVSGGTTYFYLVKALAPPTCSSPNSTEASATATGECTLAPSFAGLQTVTALGGGQGCGLRLAWNAGTANCGGPLTYSVYRSTTSGFTPGPANLLASCLAGTTHDDTTMALDTTAFYVVRAEDSGAASAGPCNGGNVESNTTQKSGFVSSTGGPTIYSNDFSVGAADWVAVPFLMGGADSWQAAIQACPAGTSILRYGNTACDTNYSVTNFVGRKPGTATGIAVPVGSTTVRLSFQHRWQFENSGTTYYDGGTLAVSLDGTTFTFVPASALLGGPAYTGNIASTTCTTAGSAGIPVWGATSTGYATPVMQTSTVNLDAVCNAITAGSGGCSGQTIHLAWIAISDCSVALDGWFIDSVAVTRDAVPACTAAPSAVQLVTATSKTQQVTLEWLNPASGPFASTRVRTSTAATPADPNAGTLVGDVAGSVNAKATTSHNAGAGSNGVPQFYSLFSNSGAAVYSARKSVSGLPVDTTTPWKWNFSTPAAALAPPIQGWGLGIFAASNDRSFYALQPGTAGGAWVSTFRPATMNGPAQGDPTVMPVAYTGLAHDAAFLGSQDGYVYCFNAVTGAACTGWPVGVGGRSAAGFGMLQSAPMLAPGAPGKLFVGTRLAAAANSMNALNVLTGATLWSFTNAVGQGGNGQAIGLISSKAYVDTVGNIVYFASRRRSGGSSNTVWAVGYGTGSPVLLWTRDLGDIDGSLSSDFTNNRLLVGTNSGAVFALNPATGATVWSRSFADGAVKTFAYFDSALQRIYFATSTKVWSIPPSGATGSDWSVTLNSPTRPLLHFGTSRVYVGACADIACASGRLVELDSANAWATPKNFDLAGGGGLGPVTIDRTQSPAMAQAGSRTGRVHAIALPLP